MQHEIIAGSTFPLLKVNLARGERVKAEAGAMVALSPGLHLTGKMEGGFGKALARMFSGESFFLQNIEAREADGYALLAAAAPGEIVPVPVAAGQELTVQKNGFLAGSAGIDVSTKVQSIARGLFSGEGLFVVKITGEGTVFLSTYGAAYSLNIPAGESMLIDNGHLIAWDAHMRYEITKGATTWVSAVTSGEGFACRFYGPGRVLIQTRNPQQLGVWLFPFLPIPRQPQR
jgi:uncharacterized protein (TIGR00266 family)